MTTQIIDVKWRETSQPHNYESGLTVWPDGSDTELFVPLDTGRQISWLIRGPRKCIGTRGLKGTMTRCPERSMVRPSFTQCGPCKALDEMNACIRCTGSVCQASEERALDCSKAAYVLYLTVFGEDLIKVGVSTYGRMMVRWLEQGADFGVKLAKIQGGRLARRIEDRISRSRDFAKAVRAERKTGVLDRTIDYTRAQQNVSRVLKPGFVETYLTADGVTVEEWPPPVTELSSFYRLQSLDSPAQLLKSKIPPEGLVLLGEVVGLKGPLLVVRQQTTFRVANLKSFVGYTLEERYNIEMNDQAALSEYL
ncbi:MAG: DUF2797 domain-containing protein [Candidatus Thorarchaeota archaeon]|nr:DUF2797 domain-containing protein [Candidatus Thorarchaeota archaeon]